jgi:hypothetical protein
MMTLLESEPRPSPTEPDALIEEAREAQRRRYRRWGGAPLLLLVLIGAGLGFLLVGGGGGRNSASGHGGAIAAKLTGRGDGILYVETTGSTVSNGRRLGGGSGKLEWWSEERPPYSYWIWSRHFQQTSVGNTITVYLPDGNQISVGDTVHGPVGERAMPPLQNRAVTFLSGAPAPGASGYSPILFSRRLAEITKDPSVTVDRNATFRGSPAISMTAAHKSANLAATLYVTRRAARPLAYIETATFFGNKNRLVQRSTTVFGAYETLAPAAVHMPNLVAEHPRAKVPPWDRAYWRRYWSRKSSGSTAQRRQALHELRN